MSAIKTKCPNLSDLSKVLGPIDGVGSKKISKPLCENIFDVQRSELFEVLESLRNSFWNDTVTIETTPPIQPSAINAPVEERPMSPSKRSRDYEDEYMSESESKPLVSKKRARMGSPQEAPAPASTQKIETKATRIMPSASRSLKTYNLLYPVKRSFIRRIKNANDHDAEVIAALTNFLQTRPKDQCQNVSRYLLPVARAMRQTRIVKVLEKWV